MSIDKIEMGLIERLPWYRDDPALRRSIDIFTEKARHQFTTDKDGSPEQIKWIIDNARRDVFDNGPQRHLEGKKRGYFGNSATLYHDAANDYREKRAAARVDDAKRRAHEQYKETAGWEGEPRQKLVPADEIAFSDNGEPYYGSKKTFPSRPAWKSER